MNKTVIFISDFDTNGSGYSNIVESIGNHLSSKYNIIGLGISYNRKMHDWLFSVSMCHPQFVPSAIASISSAIQGGVRDVFIFMDITFIEQLANIIRKEQKIFKDIRLHGIFAVEADPLLQSWAMSLMKLNSRFPISQFGENICKLAGIKSKHIPIPINLNAWRLRTNDEHLQIKEALGFKDKYLFFMNGDGNERKNISALYEAFKIVLEKEPKAHLMLLTRKNSPAGWRLDDLADQLEVTKNITVIDRGLNKEEVRKLYVAADIYIKPSKAEGCCLPILEAMAVGVPIVATNCTALSEHISDGRGVGMKPDYKWIDPFGNGHRYFVFPENMSKYMLDEIDKVRNGFDYTEQLVDARNYVESRTVETATQLLIDEIEKE